MTALKGENNNNSDENSANKEKEEDYFDLAWNNRESRRRCEVTHRKHKMADFERFNTKTKKKK